MSTDRALYLAEMPEIDLGLLNRGSVPLFDADAPHVRGTTVVDPDGGVRVYCSYTGVVVGLSAYKWRVAPDRAAGMGLLLCFYFQRTTSAQREPVPDWSAIVNRHLHGKTTDTDRLQLARAIAGVGEPVISEGDRVRVWPGVRPGRNAETTTTSGVCAMGGTSGVYVASCLHRDGRRVPGGFYALTHVDRVKED